MRITVKKQFNRVFKKQFRIISQLFYVLFTEELLNEVKRWLAGKSSTSVDLKLLARVEESILNQYKGFTTFKDLGQGSFLQFLSKNKELETLIAISGAHAEESCFGVRKTDVIDFLQQCGVDSAKV